MLHQTLWGSRFAHDPMLTLSYKNNEAYEEANQHFTVILPTYSLLFFYFIFSDVRL